MTIFNTKWQFGIGISDLPETKYVTSINSEMWKPVNSPGPVKAESPSTSICLGASKGPTMHIEITT